MKHMCTFFSALVLSAFAANALSVPISSKKSSHLAPFTVRVCLAAKPSDGDEKGIITSTKDIVSDAYLKTKDFLKDRAGNIKGVVVGAKDYMKDTVVHAKDAVLGDAETTSADVEEKADALSKTSQDYVKAQASNVAYSVSSAADDFKEEVNKKG